MRVRPLLSLCLLVALTSPAAPAQGPVHRLPPQDRLAQPRTVFSTTRRFMVSGYAARDAAELARWVEEVCRQYEESWGAVPFGRGEYVEIARAGGDAPPVFRVVQAQGVVDGRLVQRLVLADEADRDDAAEGLVALLLARGALAGGAAGTNEVRHVPDWLASGVALNLKPEARAAHRVAAMDRWRAGALIPPDEVMARAVMPEGRWTEKVDAAVFLDWVQTFAQHRAVVGEAARICMEGGSVDFSWVASRLGLGTARQAEQAYELWLAQLRDRYGGRMDQQDRALQELKEWLVIPVAQLAAAGAPRVKAPMQFAELIPHRHEPWARKVAGQAAVRLQLQVMGHAPEVRAAAEAYAEFLQALAGPPSGPLGGVWQARRSEGRLCAALQRAESMREAMERQARERAAYLEQFQTTGGTVEPAVRVYLDAWENRSDESVP